MVPDGTLHDPEHALDVVRYFTLLALALHDRHTLCPASRHGANPIRKQRGVHAPVQNHR